ncbi:MAG: M36 family metallopeptidase, partial [Planctomycetales bacterium]|nr:M36 family metallopeptidase [Planctomycetales bacterium]
MPLGYRSQRPARSAGARLHRNSAATRRGFQPRGEPLEDRRLLAVDLAWSAESLQATAINGEIHGIKWNDVDADGLFEPGDGETTLPNWEIYLDLNLNGQLDPEEPSQMTDAQGAYAFVGLDAGSYSVAEVMQTGWEQTFPQPSTGGNGGDFRLVAGTGSGDPNGFALVELQTDPAAEVPIGASGFHAGMDLDPTTGILYGASSSLRTINMNTGVTTTVGSIDSSTETGILMTAIAFSPTGELFAVTNSSTPTRRLFSIDPATAFATEVGELTEIVRAIDFAPDGTLYGGFADLFTLDPATAAVSSTVGSMGIFASEFDFAPDGMIYAVNLGTDLYAIDPATATSSIVATYAGAELFSVASVDAQSLGVVPFVGPLPLGEAVEYAEMAADESAAAAAHAADLRQAAARNEHERLQALTTGFYLPNQVRLAKSGEFLSGPSSDDAEKIARAFLREHAGELGIDADDVASLRLTDRGRSRHTGTTHLYFRQTYQGLDVVNADVNVNIMADGRVLNVGSSLVAGLDVYRSASTPRLGADEALSALAAAMDWPLEKLPEVRSLDDGVAQRALLSGSGLSLADIPAHLQYVPVRQGGVQLAWSLEVQTLDRDHWFDASVSAANGELVYLADWVDDASYEVFALPLEGPNDGGRTIEVDPHDAIASPFGWHDTDGAAGAEFTDTRGNNVSAQEDTNADNSGGFRPDGGAALDFNFAIDAAQDPSNYQEAAITNLFYWNNVLHDVHYQYGFDEVSGNFQTNNYGNGGLGGDAVQADAQDGSGTNNANFATPPDGSTPRMQQFIFTQTSPNRDSDLDNGIIVHEYGHGVSNRLTGGPANSGALNATQSGGMGEGWSDWWSLMFSQMPSDAANDAFGVGTYVLGQPVDGDGIRRFPYSFNMATDPLTYGDYNGSNEVHNSGEIWASALWDLNWLLIEGAALDPALPPGLGFDSDLYQGAGGNNLALQLVMDGLKLQPSNPSFLDARDAILAADLALTGGANSLAIWTAFARRGMGFSADDGGSANATSVTEAFDLPATSEGAIFFNLDTYEVGTSVTVTLRDVDLSGNGPVNLSIQSDGGDVETVALGEVAAGVFEATIATDGAAGAAEDGVLNVRPGQTISVSYNDADDGTGSPATVSDTANIIAFVPRVLENGSFELGNFTGWTASVSGTPYGDWTVATAGDGTGFVTPTSPQDGQYDAWNGFDGDGPLEFTLYQDLTIPVGGRSTLSWQDRVQWDFTVGGSGAAARQYEVQLRDPNSDAILDTLYSFSTGPQTENPTGDTGWQTHEVDLFSYGGQTVRLYFWENVPESYTGPGQIEIDAVRFRGKFPVAHEVEVGDGEIVTGVDFGNRELDFTGPRVIASSIVAGGIAAGPSLVYTAQFDEALDETNLDADDVSLIGALSGTHAPMSFNYDAASSTLTLGFDDLPDDDFTLTLLSGLNHFEDLDGNDLDGEAEPTTTMPSGDCTPGGDFVIEFAVDLAERDFPIPLLPIEPLGSLIYTGAIEASIQTGSDIDTYRLEVDPGQTLTVVVEGDGVLEPLAQVFDPTMAVVGNGSAAAGQRAIVQSVPTDTGGVFEIGVAGVGGSTGAYKLTVLLNSAYETGDTDLLASFSSLGNGADRAAVFGTADMTSDRDPYRFTLEDGQSATIVLAMLTGAEAALQLTASDGTTVLAEGISSQNASLVINNFVDLVDGSPGAYFATVVASGDYTLTVTRGADFDTEGNSDFDTAQDISGIGSALGHIIGGTGEATQFDTPILNFDGQGFTGAQPPDTVGDVGLNYYIQMLNGPGGADFTIYDKTDGSLVMGPLALDSLAPSGTPGADGAGDPVVLYDHLANRWLLAEFGASTNGFSMFVSQTDDPTDNLWHHYFFQTNEFPDYPKFAVWPDAYYVTSNESSPAVYALDRNAMLQGLPAADPVRDTAPNLNGFGFQALTP